MLSEANIKYLKFNLNIFYQDLGRALADKSTDINQIQMMENINVDFYQYAARKASLILVSSADLVLVIKQNYIEKILSKYLEAREKAQLKEKWNANK